MRTRILLSFCVIAAMTTTAAAAAKAKPPAPPSDVGKILQIVMQMQSDVKALQTAVANLEKNQNSQTAQVATQLKDMARRLYATCVLTQRQMDITVPGGWSENKLCTYQGLIAGGEVIRQEIFGQNPTSIDAPFGGP
jgi:hypothetical protein